MLSKPDPPPRSGGREGIVDVEQGGELPLGLEVVGIILENVAVLPLGLVRLSGRERGERRQQRRSRSPSRSPSATARRAFRRMSDPRSAQADATASR